MKKVLLILLSLVAVDANCQSKYVTLPITQTQAISVGYKYRNLVNFTSGYDVNTLANLDYSLFNSFGVYNEDGLDGSFTTAHGKYISFKFMGGASSSGVQNGMAYWTESKQLAFYSAWNQYRLSAFVLNGNNLHLVDVEKDEIIGTFPVDDQSSISIMVFSSRLSSTGIHYIAIECSGVVSIYDSLPNPSNVSATRANTKPTYRIYNMAGHQLHGFEPGINIVTDSDGSTKKVLK